MQIVEQTLLAFFERVAQKDSAQLKILNQESCFKVERGRWTFTLPDLHVFLQRQHDEIFKAVEYRQFRAVVFNSAINQAIKSHGAEIVIACNHGKVDQSEYALIWQVTK